MRRDLPGSFRFGMLASIALALSGQPTSISRCSPRWPVPQASSSNGGTAAIVTAPALPLAIPAAARQRARAVGSAGNWREGEESRDARKGRSDVIAKLWR